jgi:hypothetical protein
MMFFEISKGGIGVSLIELGMWIRLCGNTFPCLVGTEILGIALFSFLSESFKNSSERGLLYPQNDP